MKVLDLRHASLFFKWCELHLFLDLIHLLPQLNTSSWPVFAVNTIDCLRIEVERRQVIRNASGTLDFSWKALVTISFSFLASKFWMMHIYGGLITLSTKFCCMLGLCISISWMELRNCTLTVRGSMNWWRAIMNIWKSIHLLIQVGI